MPREVVTDIYDITCTDALGRLRAFVADYDRPTLVDTGLADTTDALLDGIREIGVEPERLIITHGDPDHVGGYEAVLAEYDLEVHVPEKIKVSFDREPDNRFGDGEAIGPFETIFVGGHTPGSSAVVDPDRGVLIAGDTLVGADWRGLPPGYPLTPPEYFSADVAEAERNVERLLRHDFDSALVFHGSSIVENAHGKLNDFVNFPGKGR